MAIGAILAGIGKATQVAAPAAIELWNTWQSKKQQDWQKEAQKITWNREDTARQRGVADMKAAGLSPTLAAGSPAATSSPTTPKASSYSQEKILNLMTMKANIARTYAETDLIEANANVAKASVSSNIEKARYQSELTQAQRNLAIVNAAYEESRKSGYAGMQANQRLIAESQYWKLRVEELQHNLGIAKSVPVRMTTDHQPWLQLGSSAAQNLWSIGKSATDFTKRKDSK